MTTLLRRGGLYAIVDPDQTGAFGALDLAAAAIRGGACAVQLRVKHDRDATTVELGRALRRLTREAQVAFVVNDRADLAALLEADALHLGQEDLPIERARSLLPDLPISLSTHSLTQALDAERRGAFAIGFGPVFETRSKQRPDAIVGLNGLDEVCTRVGIPVIAIGGIDASRVPDVASRGARCFAVISALSGATDVESHARAMQAAFESARRR